MKPNPELSLEISRSLNISSLVSQVLINRGLNTPGQVDSFLSATLSSLHSPFIMKDMDKAVDRIIAAVCSNEKICIYGDYDADGITAHITDGAFFKAGKCRSFFLHSGQSR